MNHPRTVALLLLLSHLQAEASPTLRFAAQIRDEELAEEAIQLLHCLSTRTGADWELSPRAQGPHFLRLEQRGESATGEYRRDGSRREVTLAVGEASELCDELAPALGSPEFAPTPSAAAGLGESLNLPTDPAPRRPWLWAAAAGLVGLSGFLWWKSRRPHHRTLRME